jgi:diguanylate cyclase (GGDEF)-like protein/PAS domain S-box-containing protein
MNITARKHENGASQVPLVYLSTHFIQAKEYLEAIFTSASDAIITTDMHGRVMYFSPGAEKMLGLRGAAAAGTSVRRFYEGGRPEAEKVMNLLIKKGKLADYETRFKTKNGKIVHVSMSAALLKDRTGRLIGTLGISKDISRRVELEQELRELSITDNLTGLYNQRYCAQRLEAEVERAKRQDSPLSILVIDMDNFKQANDSLGHLEGDRILRETADILRQSVRHHVDAAFRYGGDEFVVLLPGLDRRTAGRVARRIREAARKKYFAPLVGLSIGTAALSHAESASSLLRRADRQMYAAKRRRKRAV